MNPITKAILESDKEMKRALSLLPDKLKEAIIVISHSRDRKILEAVIALSDEIECRYDCGGKEWYGFKGLRNAISDAIKDIK